MTKEKDFIHKQRMRLLDLLEAELECLKVKDSQLLLNKSSNQTLIEFALKRIEEGQYGLCTNCGCMIEKELLDKIPESPKCVSCRNKAVSFQSLQ